MSGSDFNYESLGLCFDQGINIDPPSGFDKELDNSRSDFIIKTCHGTDPCADPDDDYYSDQCDSADARLTRLSDEVAALEAYAEDQARRLTFDTSDPATLAAQLEEAGDPATICGSASPDCLENANLCLQLQTCYKERFSGAFSSEDIDVDELFDDQFLYTQCYNTTNEDLKTTTEGVCNNAESAGCSSYDISNGLGFCGDGTNPTEPVCPERINEYFESFDPAYPNPSDNSDYGLAVAVIQDLYLCNTDGEIDYTDRTSADVVGITLIIKIGLEAAKIASEILKDSLPHWEPYIFKIFPYQGFALALNVVDKVYGVAGFHDGLVDGAEMQAIYQNT